jgi:hypothetical protein
VLVEVAVAWVGVEVGVRLAVAVGSQVSGGICSIISWIVLVAATVSVGTGLIGTQAWMSRPIMTEITAILGTSSVYHKKFAFASH